MPEPSLIPEMARQQFEGAATFSASLACYGEITAKNGVIQQSNFDSYKLARMNTAPRETFVHLVDSDRPPAGIGEPGVPPFVSSVVQRGICRDRQASARFAVQQAGPCIATADSGQRIPAYKAARVPFLFSNSCTSGGLNLRPGRCSAFANEYAATAMIAVSSFTMRASTLS